MFGELGAPGMVLVIVRRDRSLVLGYGETAKDNGRQPDGDSLLRLNSITKVFTGEVLAALATDGKLRLTDPLQRYAGKVTVPSFGRARLRSSTWQPIPPRCLAKWERPRRTRTPAGGRRTRTVGGGSRATSFLGRRGAIAAYSNIGFDLAADAAETAGARPYPELLAEYVTRPLGMTDTVFAPTPGQCARLMVGSGLGGAAACVDTQATDGSGGLYSTGNDMARWLRHNLNDTDGALALAHAVYRPRQALDAAIGFDDAGPMEGLALGWVVIAADGVHPMMLAKSGGGAGFMSYMAFAPGRDVGVFVAVNRLDFGMFLGLAKTANNLIATLAIR